jgi:hypothetical protein
MLTISVGAARAIAGVLTSSTDTRVKQFASSLAGEADAAVAAGETSFDLSQTAASMDDAARSELEAAIQAAQQNPA